MPHIRLRSSHALLLPFLFVACAQPLGDDLGVGGAGNESGGSSASSGGHSSSGGSHVGSGGAHNTGGSQNSGGTVSTGGSQSSGGTASTGGTASGGSASGGAVATGGTASGGSSGTGGTVATGGASSSGGSAATGGSSGGGNCTDVGHDVTIDNFGTTSGRCFTITLSGTTMYGWAVYRNHGRTLTINGVAEPLADGDSNHAALSGAGPFTFQFGASNTADTNTGFDWW